LRLEKLGPVRTWIVKKADCRQLNSLSSHFFMCFGGRFRLSAITRVTAGESPDCRAARRASFPRSNTFFFLLRISAFLRGYFLHRAPSLVDGLIRVRKRSRIGISDVNAAKGLSANFAG
jgi:hypothetical protein